MSPTCKDAVSLSLGRNSIQTTLEIKFKSKKKKKRAQRTQGKKSILPQYLPPEEDVTDINSHLHFGDGNTGAGRKDRFASRVCSKSAVELEGERPSPRAQSFALAFLYIPFYLVLL